MKTFFQLRDELSKTMELMELTAEYEMLGVWKHAYDSITENNSVEMETAAVESFERFEEFMFGQVAKSAGRWSGGSSATNHAELTQLSVAQGVFQKWIVQGYPSSKLRRLAQVEKRLSEIELLLEEK